MKIPLWKRNFNTSFIKGLIDGSVQVALHIQPLIDMGPGQQSEIQRTVPKSRKVGFWWWNLINLWMLQCDVF